MKVTHKAILLLIEMQKEQIVRYINRIDVLKLNHAEVVVAVLVRDETGNRFMPGLLTGEYERHHVADVVVTVGLVSRPYAQSVLLEGEYMEESKLLGQDNVRVFVTGFDAFAACGIPEWN